MGAHREISAGTKKGAADGADVSGVQLGNQITFEKGPVQSRAFFAGASAPNAHRIGAEQVKLE